MIRAHIELIFQIKVTRREANKLKAVYIEMKRMDCLKNALIEPNVLISTFSLT